MTVRQRPRSRTGPEGNVNTVVGRTLMERRLVVGKTRTDVEIECGLPRGALRRIETGVRSVSAGEVFYLTRSLGITPSDAFGDISHQTDDRMQPDRRETERLLKYFFRIDDAAMRKRLLRLVQSAAEQAGEMA